VATGSFLRDFRSASLARWRGRNPLVSSNSSSLEISLSRHMGQHWTWKKDPSRNVKGSPSTFLMKSWHCLHFSFWVISFALLPVSVSDRNSLWLLVPVRPGFRGCGGA